jgi:hypothetical protein
MAESQANGVTQGKENFPALLKASCDCSIGEIQWEDLEKAQRDALMETCAPESVRRAKAEEPLANVFYLVSL